MNETLTTQSSSITFYCPNHLKNNFDELVKFKRLSRTSTINHLMERWVRSEFDRMKIDDDFQSLINDIRLRNHKNNIPKPSDNPLQSDVKSTDYSPPNVPSFNDDYDWEERLFRL